MIRLVLNVSLVWHGGGLADHDRHANLSSMLPMNPRSQRVGCVTTRRNADQVDRMDVRHS